MRWVWLLGGLATVAYLIQAGSVWGYLVALAVALFFLRNGGKVVAK